MAAARATISACRSAGDRRLRAILGGASSMLAVVPFAPTISKPGG